MIHMAKQEDVSLRLEDYLTTIYRLEEALGEARITDISQELSVRPATASKIIAKLEEKGYVKRAKYKNITLTPTGKEIAEKIIRKHRIAEVFLSRVLGFNELESHVYAHSLEHLPDVVIERIYETLDKPTLCPHGNPIPGEPVEKSTSINILEAEIGQNCVVSRIAGEFTSILQYLYNHRVKHGAKIRIVDKTNVSIHVATETGSILEIPFRIARFIRVYCEIQ